MTGSRVWKIFAGALLILLFAAINAHAAEEGGGATTERAKEIFKWINFAIVAGLLAWVFLKLTPPFFRKNAETISAAISKATAAKAEADSRLREAEEKLARLDQEVAQLRATAQREMAAETERLRAATESDIQRVGLAAKAEIEAAERAARLELKAAAANLAVDEAETLLTKELTPKVQESLVGAFVKNLEGSPN
ncbi:MAG: H+-transporting two-sector ATPase, subunit [Candidatus Acidoferrum typicum]|jgi:F-type H+-transporting ATPase subunit b|nr:H+-transporting two-sector ATPase, subunit [Candidatus Acidoferrum typicum]